jgi:hypothetical protein
VPQNTETAAVKPRVGVKGSPRGVCSLLKWGREHERSRPSPFTIDDFRLPIFRHVARQLAQQSLQNSARLGQHQGGVPFFGES